MIREKVIILNGSGLNSRFAIAFLKEASKFNCDVILVKNSNEYNGKSILSILSMSAINGDEIEIVTNGEDEVVAMNNIIKFFENINN